MTRDQFCALVSKYLSDVNVTAVKLYDDGVAHDRCVPIAISLVDAKDLTRARLAQALATPRRVVRATNGDH